MATIITDRTSGLRSATAYKGPVLVASLTNLTLSGLQTVDGEALAEGDRVLVTGQDDATENGIYVASSGQWQRAADFSRNDDVRTGTTVRVNSGANAGRYILSTADPIVFGTSSITFEEETLAPSEDGIGSAINNADAATIADADKLGFFSNATSLLKSITWASLKAAIFTSTAKTTPVDADKMVISDSAASDVAKSVTLSNLAVYILSKVASAANFRADTNGLLGVNNVWEAAEEVTLTDAATIAVDFSTFINGVVTLAGNRTLGQPSNLKVGQSGVIRVVQDGTGSRTLAYHADYEFAGGTAPTLSTGAGDTDLLSYYVIAANRVFISLVGKDIS